MTTVRWYRVAELQEAEGASPWLPVRVVGLDVVLARVDGAWYGVEDRCTHAGCAFSEDAALEGAVIVCDCHGSEFDLRSGEVVRGPADRPVRTFPVRVRADRIEVEA